MKIETVVVGLDFSEPSLDAAAWTARHFTANGRLLIVHCLSVPEPPRFLKGRFPPAEELLANARRGADGRLREVVQSLGSQRAESVIREGQPAEQLELVAREAGADIIVVGPHADRPGIWRLIGGTAQRIACRSRVPVLVARGLRSAPPSHILVPLDDSALTEPVLAWAAALSRRFSARLTALHVIPDSLLGALQIGGTEAERRSAAANLQRAAERWLAERLRDAGLQSDRETAEVLVGDAASEILSAAERLGADLIVMGRSGTGQVGDLILGSVANSVLRNGGGPLFLVGNEPSD